MLHKLGSRAREISVPGADKAHQLSQDVEYLERLGQAALHASFLSEDESPQSAHSLQILGFEYFDEAREIREVAGLKPDKILLVIEQN